MVLTSAPSEMSEPTEDPRGAPTRPRLDSIDLVRGVVMVIMVLDHVREFFGNAQLNPTDLTKTTTALFFTRWITHFCAPTFVFLAGTGAYLAGRKSSSRRDLAVFLFTRGLWLIFLELTVIRFGLTFNPMARFIPLTVIWVIGLSMVILSGLVFLPTGIVGLLGVLTIVGHNAFDGFHSGLGGLLGSLGGILHQPGLVAVVLGRPIFALYSLIPWVGVLASGYALGALYQFKPERRRLCLITLGLVLTLAFVGLRMLNLYGDPRPWSSQRLPMFTLLSFLNCEKYPPSLLFLLMTLGPAILALGIFDGNVGRRGQPLVTLGRVPLFYYIVQWYVIHSLAYLVAVLRGQPAAWLLGNGPFEAPSGYGASLSFIYLMWMICVALLYPLSRWFAGVKKRNRSRWLSYL